MVSFIIAYHNEGERFLFECVRQLKETCGIEDYEIIIVDDGSDVPLSKTLGARIIRHTEKKGVGYVFDNGIYQSKGEYIIMMGCDLRFNQKGWAKSLLDDVIAHPNALICTRCLALRREQMDFDEAFNHPSGYGCDMLLKYEKDVLRARWANPRNEEIYKTPCIMGACYGFTKEWYNYIDGWNMYRDKGYLEGFISTKSWLFGGECLIDRTIQTWHIFRDRDEHGRLLKNEYYNKMLIDYWFFGEKFTPDLPQSNSTNDAKKTFNNNIIDINKKKAEYAKKVKLDIDFYLEHYLTTDKLNRL